MTDSSFLHGGDRALQERFESGRIRIAGPPELAFPDCDGIGMFRSLGNLVTNPQVGMLFIALHGTPRRLRVNGVARIDPADPLTGGTVGAQMTVRVAAEAIFPNCPRYIPNSISCGRRPVRPWRAAIRSSRPGRASMPSGMPSIRGS